MKWIILDRYKIKVYGKKSKLVIKGIAEEHKAFLHNLLTNDINGLKEGFFNYNLRLNGKGYPTQDFFVFNLGDFFILDTEEKASEIIEEFNKLKLSMQVFFEDLTPNYKHIHIFGKDSEEFIKKNFDISLQNFQFKLLDGLIIAKNFLRTGNIGFDVFGNIEQVLNLLDEKDKISNEEFENERIKNCIPKIKKELKEGYLPNESPIFPYAVSLTKGCYIGQEVVARVHYRGNPPRTTAKFTFEGNLKEGEKIFIEDKKVGEITSISPLENVALGYILKAKLSEKEFKTENGNKIKLVEECNLNGKNN